MQHLAMLVKRSNVLDHQQDERYGRVLVNASYLHVYNGAAAELVSFDELAQLCEHQVYTSYINF